MTTLQVCRARCTAFKFHVISLIAGLSWFGYPLAAAADIASRAQAWQCEQMFQGRTLTIPSGVYEELRDARARLMKFRQTRQSTELPRRIVIHQEELHLRELLGNGGEGTVYSATAGASLVTVKIYKDADSLQNYLATVAGKTFKTTNDLPLLSHDPVQRVGVFPFVYAIDMEAIMRPGFYGIDLKISAQAQRWAEHAYEEYNRLQDHRLLYGNVVIDLDNLRFVTIDPH